jgi:hypothetical protein
VPAIAAAPHHRREGQVLQRPSTGASTIGPHRAAVEDNPTLTNRVTRGDLYVDDDQRVDSPGRFVSLNAVEAAVRGIAAVNFDRTPSPSPGRSRDAMI